MEFYKAPETKFWANAVSSSVFDRPALVGLEFLFSFSLVNITGKNKQVQAQKPCHFGVLGRFKKCLFYKDMSLFIQTGCFLSSTGTGGADLIPLLDSQNIKATTANLEGS